jgi:hypothetical protein
MYLNLGAEKSSYVARIKHLKIENSSVLFQPENVCYRFLRNVLLHTSDPTRQYNATNEADEVSVLPSTWVTSRTFGLKEKRRKLPIYNAEIPRLNESWES